MCHNISAITFNNFQQKKKNEEKIGEGFFWDYDPCDPTPLFVSVPDRGHFEENIAKKRLVKL